MRRTFIILLAMILWLFASAPPAYGMVLKDTNPPPGMPRIGIVIVGVSTYIGDWENRELGPNVVTNDAYAKRLAEAFMKKPGIHYVDVLTGSEATGSGILSALTRAQNEQLALLVFAYRGYGLGADARAPCFAAADWDHTHPKVSCLPVGAVNDTLVSAAPRQLVLLDAAAPSPAVTAALKADTFGPTADDWPLSSDTTVVSSAKTERYVECNVFWPMVTAVVGAGKPEDGLTYGDFTTRLDQITSAPPNALPPGVQLCGTPPQPLQPAIETKWFSDVVVIPAGAMPKPEPVVTTTVPLPTTVVKPTSTMWKRDGKASKATVAAAIATGALAVAAGGTTAYGYYRLDQYNDRSWVEAQGYDTASRQAAADKELPVYGAAAIVAGAFAAVGMTITVVTW